jgi:hypothetical protein
MWPNMTRWNASCSRRAETGFADLLSRWHWRVSGIGGPPQWARAAAPGLAGARGERARAWRCAMVSFRGHVYSPGGPYESSQVRRVWCWYLCSGSVPGVMQWRLPVATHVLRWLSPRIWQRAAGSAWCEGREIDVRPGLDKSAMSHYRGADFRRQMIWQQLNSGRRHRRMRRH